MTADDTENAVPTLSQRPPKGLGRAGRRAWKSIATRYVLRPDELLVLESACRCADVVAKLEDDLSGQPLIVKGSMGQEREHPLLSEQRQQRALLTRLLVQLKLPDLEPGAVDDQAMARSVKARAAARSRWAQHRDGMAR
ncbi:MAG: hypothetical protein QM747_03270 [Nocardioides sp.]